MPADRAFYFDRLYPLQDEVLTILRRLETGFYLTGGTAASRGYLQHRFSDDLDLFVNGDRSVRLWADRFVAALTERPLAPQRLTSSPRSMRSRMASSSSSARGYTWEA